MTVQSMWDEHKHYLKIGNAGWKLCSQNVFTRFMTACCFHTDEAPCGQRRSWSHIAHSVHHWAAAVANVMTDFISVLPP